MQTDRAKYIRGQAVMLQPQGTLFVFPVSRLNLLERSSAAHQPTTTPTSQLKRESYSHLSFSSVLRNAFELFRSFSITLLTLWQASGAQWRLQVKGVPFSNFIPVADWSGAIVCTSVTQYNLNGCTADAMTTHNSICDFKIAFNAKGLIWL